MNLSRVRSMLEEAGRQRRQGWGISPSGDTSQVLRATPPMSVRQNDESFQQAPCAALSDEEMLERARAAYIRENFTSLAAGPEANGPWSRVEAADRFVVFRREVAEDNNVGAKCNGLEVLCAGRLDASLEEVDSILRSNSEGELNSAMAALYSKSFIFGSYEREIPCTNGQTNDEEDVDDGREHLVVKTKSFARTTLLGHNEQWCYFDYFRRKEERDGFTITKRALPASEPISGRITVKNANVDQLHGLNASYLVDKLPDRKGLRVVFHAWFEPSEDEDDQSSGSSRSTSSNSCHRSNTSSSSESRSKMNRQDLNKHKAQMRRLLAMARGVTHLPKIVRRRRFGLQVPANLSAIRSHNTRCPCCTHSLAPMKLSLSIAASAIANRSLANLKIATRRCYLCGYLVCANCWTAEHMESSAGRITAIAVCTRCHANVQACEYSEVFAAQHENYRGPPRVVEDSNNEPTIRLLIEALNDSLSTETTESAEHTATMDVIRTLLRLNEEHEDEGEGDIDTEFQRNVPRFELLGDTETVKKLEGVLTDKNKLPSLSACKLGNAEQRNYRLDLPDNSHNEVPRSPIPHNEVNRIAAAKAAGLLRLANLLAPEIPSTDLSEPKPDTHELELLCQLAAKTMDCAYSFVAIMCAKHEHFLAGNQPGIAGAVMPREHTTCQHAIMAPEPFVVTHPEADVRLHKTKATVQFGIRFYVGFPLTLRVTDGRPGGEEMTVGTLCCIDTKPRAEVTRTQYATMKLLASAATHFLLQKCRQI